MWTDLGNGKQRNDAVAADPVAIQRGGYVEVDTGILKTILAPWDDGGDTLELSFLGTVSNVAPLPGGLGWEGDYVDTGLTPGKWWAGVADLSGVKGQGRLGDAMSLFQAQGAQSYLRCTIDEVPVSGDWEIEKQLGGNWQDFDYGIEPETPTLPGATQDGPHVPYAIVPWHKTKWGNKVTTAQACLIPRPVAACIRSNGAFLGYVYGRHEIDTGTGRIKKIFDAAAVRAISGQTAFVVMDEIVGYSSNGTTDLNTPSGSGGIWQATESGVIDEVHVWTSTAGSQNNNFLMGVYDAAAASPPGVVGSTIKTNGRAPSVTVPANETTGVDTGSTFVTKPTITAGDDIVIAARTSVAGHDIRYAATSGFEISYNGTYSDPLPDTIPSETQNTTVRFSMYIVTSGGGGGGTGSTSGPFLASVGRLMN
jgi:hypothetical protein